jgi:hypothetical protein
MGRRGAERDDGSGGKLARAWRWLQSSGFAEDDALFGPPRPDLGKERFWLAVLTQASSGEPTADTSATPADFRLGHTWGMDHRTTRGTSGLSRTPRTRYSSGEMVGASRSLRPGFFLTRKRSGSNRQGRMQRSGTLVALQQRGSARPGAGVAEPRSVLTSGSGRTR